MRVGQIGPASPTHWSLVAHLSARARTSAHIIVNGGALHWIRIAVAGRRCRRRRFTCDICSIGPIKVWRQPREYMCNVGEDIGWGVGWTILWPCGNMFNIKSRKCDACLNAVIVIVNAIAIETTLNIIDTIELTHSTFDDLVRVFFFFLRCTVDYSARRSVWPLIFLIETFGRPANINVLPIFKKKEPILTIFQQIIVNKIIVISKIFKLLTHFIHQIFTFDHNKQMIKRTNYP